MAISNVEPKHIMGRIRRLVLGREKPNFLTRISCGLGLLVWIYLASWHMFTLIALFFYETLYSSDQIRAAFGRVGGRYGLDEPINLLVGHAFVQLALYFLMFIGLILIYRKKKIGFLLYVIPGASTFVATFILLGSTYMKNETSWTDSVILGISIIYFGIGALIFYRKKSGPGVDEDSA